MDIGHLWPWKCTKKFENFPKRTKNEQNHQFLDNTHFLLEFKGHLIKKKIIISMLYLDVPVNPMYILYFHFCSALVAYIYSMKQNMCIYVFKICSNSIAIWIFKKILQKMYMDDVEHKQMMMWHKKLFSFNGRDAFYFSLKKTRAYKAWQF